jgi:hypothetical protein
VISTVGRSAAPKMAKAAMAAIIIGIRKIRVPLMHPFERNYVVRSHV